MLFRNCLWEYILKQGNPIQPSALLFSYCLVSKLHGIAESIWFSQGCLLLSRFDPPLRRLCKKLLNDSLCVFHRCEDPSSATYNPTTYCSAPVNTFSLTLTTTYTYTYNPTNILLSTNQHFFTAHFTLLHSRLNNRHLIFSPMSANCTFIFLTRIMFFFGIIQGR